MKELRHAQSHAGDGSTSYGCGQGEKAERCTYQGVTGIAMAAGVILCDVFANRSLQAKIEQIDIGAHLQNQYPGTVLRGCHVVHQEGRQHERNQHREQHPNEVGGRALQHFPLTRHLGHSTFRCLQKAPRRRRSAFGRLVSSGYQLGRVPVGAAV